MTVQHLDDDPSQAMSRIGVRSLVDAEGIQVGMRWLPVVMLVAIMSACGPNAAPITLEAQGTATPVPWKIEPTPTATTRVSDERSHH